MNSDIPTPSSTSMTKHFDFKTREPELYALWERREAFNLDKARDPSAPVFSLAAPPPNANGELHLGHALGCTIMDIFTRHHRALGYRTLLVPGKDHAGIQTQVVYEKKLKSEGFDTANATREKLYSMCYDFCIDRSQYMRAQEKMLGFSADWTRELFTLDPRLESTIYETFERLWRDGLVYKGKRIVNWSVFSQSSISDVEVDYKEQDGNLWYICYPLVEPGAPGDALKLPSGDAVRIGERGIFSATTRPETMLGDTALAVHPEDERYKAFVGKFIRVPLTGRTIPIVADTRVDASYGTGVIKVTPAHDFLDYDMGRDHGLELLQVIGQDGKMTEAAGPEFKGLSTAECRAKVVEQLSTQGLLVDITPIKHKVPIGERGKDIIEPLVSEQWFLAVDKPGHSLKQRALELLRSGAIKVHPARFQELFEQWLENLRDWNISRQLWWGQRIPVWYKRTGGKEEIHVGAERPAGDGWEPETDVFDTWFSSGQWAFSTMSALDLVDLESKSPKSDFFPNHTMLMGRDILFFWACRMLLLTTYRCDTIPWRNIFFTGLLRDEHGQKMSKSKGNGVDPIEAIGKFGTDSLRLALVMGATPGNDLSFSERKLDGYSKFINKLWNAAKLIDMKVRPLAKEAVETPKSLELETSRWICGTLSRLRDVVTQKIAEFEASIALDELYGFSWTVYCDWYLEMLKALAESNNPAWQKEIARVSVATFRQLLALLHPYIPFVTEEIYQQLEYLRTAETLAESAWSLPLPAGSPSPAVHLIQDATTSIRSVKAALQIPHQTIRVALSETVNDEARLLIQAMARCEICVPDSIPAEKALRKPLGLGYVILEVEGKDAYRQKLEKDLETNHTVVKSLETKLAGAFAQHAKPEIVEKEREKLASARNAIVEIERELTGF